MSAHTLDHSRCHVVDDGSGSLHLIDNGVDTDANWELLGSALAAEGYGMRDVASITLTHLHHDHCGMTARIVRESGAIVRMHQSDARCLHEQRTYRQPQAVETLLQAWGVPQAMRPEVRVAAVQRISEVAPFVVGVPLQGGEVLASGALAWRVLHVPGHTAGHIVIADDDARTLYSGDHLLPGVTPGVGLGERIDGDDPMGDYLGALERTAVFDDYEVHPGHGAPFRGARHRGEQIRARHLARGRDVAAIVTAAPGARVWDVARALRWRGGFADLRGTALLSALAQTEMHIRRADSQEMT